MSGEGTQCKRSAAGLRYLFNRAWRWGVAQVFLPSAEKAWPLCGCISSGQTLWPDPEN